MGEEAGQGVLLDRLDFAAEFGERLAANLAEDFGVAPLAMKAAGTESALENAAFVGKLAERIFNHCGIERKAFGGLAQGEWAVGAGISGGRVQGRAARPAQAARWAGREGAECRARRGSGRRLRRR